MSLHNQIFVHICMQYCRIKSLICIRTNMDSFVLSAFVNLFLVTLAFAVLSTCSVLEKQSQFLTLSTSAS